MSKFAKIDEEVFRRHKEVVGENGKPAKETLFLYQLIVLHSWDGGICKKTLPELCEIYELDYDNSTRRVKNLRVIGWLENTKKHLRPLIIHKSKTVDSTVGEQTQTVKSTVSDADKTVKSTVENCKIYSKTDVETVKSTVSNGETSIPINGYPASKTSLNLKTKEDLTAADNNIEKTDVVSSSSSNKNLSQFSPEECLRYIEIRIANGEKLETPHRLARWAHQTGEMDAFILATLYPEQIQTQQIIVEQQIEYDDNFEHFDARSFAEEWAETLEYLRELGADVSERRGNYAPEIWARLMEALNG